MKNSIRIVRLIFVFLIISRCKSPDEKQTKTDSVETTRVVVDSASSSVISNPLQLIINNLASASAPVVVIVYNSKNKFLKENGRYRRYRHIPQGYSINIKIRDLEYGEFAIAIFQDMNNNGEMDKNVIGIPTEGYAFSNNYRPTIQAPEYQDCKFLYHSKTPPLKIKLLK